MDTKSDVPPVAMAVPIQAQPMAVAVAQPMPAAQGQANPDDPNSNFTAGVGYT